MDSLKGVFLAEGREHLEALESSLLSLERDPSNEDSIHAAFRAAHTIKGSSGVADAMLISEFMHDVENILDRMREATLLADPDLITVLLVCTDHVQKLLNDYSDDVTSGADTLAVGDALLRQLTPWLQVARSSEAATPADTSEAVIGSEDPAVVGLNCWHISLRLGREIFLRGVDPISLIRYLGHLGEVVRIHTLYDAMPSDAEMDVELCYLGFEIDVHGDALVRNVINEGFAFIEGECTLSVMAPHCGLGDYAKVAHAYGEAGAAWLRSLVNQGSLTVQEHDGVLQMQTAPAPTRPVALASEPLHPKNEASKTTATVTANTVSPQLRVDADKLDKLVALVGELVIAGEAASVMASRVGREELTEALSVLTHLIEDMRESAMQMRMVQIGATFNRFQRVVRDVSRELGKDIRLVTIGDDTELDKSVVEKIGDPLMHLVRNSIDHGIESAQLRLAAGKPEEGRLTLSANHEANHIVIRISDDGGGLNTQRILEKAIERKLVLANQTLTNLEIHQLIFEPGFSTADQVTALSGRGVGMDVVRRNIQALRGDVGVQSTAGQGCVFTIRLPLTLAIIDGFRVGIEDSHFVIPLDMVEECIQFQGNQGSCNYVSLRGEMLPYVRLHDVFGFAPAQADVAQNVVIVKYAGQKVGIVVERLYGEMKAVIKPLGMMFQGIEGLSGSTLLGGGEIAVILDIPSLIHNIIQRSGHGMVSDTSV
jgi:two-component system, chemotaxis family, sensor kinase CheA